MTLFSSLTRRLALASALLFALAAVASAGTVTISSPVNNSTSGSPIAVKASATSSSAIKLLQVYLDGTKKYEVAAASLSTSLATTAGAHRVTVQAYDSANNIFKSTSYVTVGSTSTSSTSTTTSSGSTSTTTTTSTGSISAPSTAATIASIDQKSGWTSCGACAGANGSGPNTPHSMSQGISSPSLDGSSAQFTISPVTSYSDALWWNQLGAQSGATNFVYDIYFYMKSPSTTQALEFDANQSVGGRKYIFGTQCDIKGAKQWQVWDSVNKWVNTGIACSTPSAYTWHHLTWQFQRSGSRTYFVAMTLDGVTHYVNQYHNSQASSVNELNVAFQIDSNSSLSSITAWLDKVSLKYW